ncbi:unnamed protein product [Amoebophrya sp. A25]|nr:unnamed protein product [Amoebophrya sp. A25]|eukprot:GSA25T00027371001.1
MINLKISFFLIFSLMTPYILVIFHYVTAARSLYQRARISLRPGSLTDRNSTYIQYSQSGSLFNNSMLLRGRSPLRGV